MVHVVPQVCDDCQHDATAHERVPVERGYVGRCKHCEEAGSHVKVCTRVFRLWEAPMTWFSGQATNWPQVNVPPQGQLPPNWPFNT